MFDVVELGLKPNEHLRRFGSLEGPIAEKTIDQYDRLVVVASCAERILPSLQWHAAAMDEADRQKLLELEAAVAAAWLV